MQDSLRAEACAAGLTPGPAPVRRLSRSQYSATVRDLLNLHVDAGATLPADGAGGEGFDNAAETLFLSPIHAEKYLEAAKQALTAAAKDPRARAKFLIAKPGQRNFASAGRAHHPRRFPAASISAAGPETDVDVYLALFDSAQKQRRLLRRLDSLRAPGRADLAPISVSLGAAESGA